MGSNNRTASTASMPAYQQMQQCDLVGQSHANAWLPSAYPRPRVGHAWSVGRRPVPKHKPVNPHAGWPNTNSAPMETAPKRLPLAKPRGVCLSLDSMTHRWGNQMTLMVAKCSPHASIVRMARRDPELHARLQVSLASGGGLHTSGHQKLYPWCMMCETLRRRQSSVAGPFVAACA